MSYTKRRVLLLERKKKSLFYKYLNIHLRACVEALISSVTSGVVGVGWFIGRRLLSVVHELLRFCVSVSLPVGCCLP